MKKFNAKKCDDKVIELTSSSDLEDLFNTILREQDFIIQWNEGKEQKSELIIGTDLASKIKTGDIKIISSETKR